MCIFMTLILRKPELINYFDNILQPTENSLSNWSSQLSSKKFTGASNAMYAYSVWEVYSLNQSSTWPSISW